MAKVCEICGKGPATGNSVSHSVRRTKRRFLPNLVKKRVIDPLTNLLVRKKVCTACLRTMNKRMAKASA